jgi:hypothetical protein
MVTIGVAVGVIVAFGTIATGVISGIRWIFKRGRQAEMEDAYKAKIAAELEDIKRRLQDEKRQEKEI